MQRDQLEHVIRAASAITGASEIVVIGSQSVLGQHPDAPAELRVSIEADVFTFRDPADADLIDGSIGEGSPFHQTFGYYAHGVARDTAVLPRGWEDRLVRVANANTGTGVGLCLEAHDLAVSKWVAGREKDLDYVRAMARLGLVHIDLLRARLAETSLPDHTRALCDARLKTIGS